MSAADNEAGVEEPFAAVFTAGLAPEKLDAALAVVRAAGFEPLPGCRPCASGPVVFLAVRDPDSECARIVRIEPGQPVPDPRFRVAPENLPVEPLALALAKGGQNLIIVLDGANYLQPVDAGTGATGPKVLIPGESVSAVDLVASGGCLVAALFGDTMHHLSRFDPETLAWQPLPLPPGFPFPEYRAGALVPVAGSGLVYAVGTSQGEAGTAFVAGLDVVTGRTAVAMLNGRPRVLRLRGRELELATESGAFAVIFDGRAMNVRERC